MTWLSPGMFTGSGVWYRVFAWESMCQHQRHPETPASSQHTPLGAPGLYIQTLLPGSPAASDGRLSLGDRILEVNGSSLMGVSYMRYVPYLACNTGLAERVGVGWGCTCKPVLHSEAGRGRDHGCCWLFCTITSRFQGGRSDSTWRQEDAISSGQV